MRTLTPTGTVVDYPATPQLTHQLRPVSALVRELVRELRPTPAAPRPTTSEEARRDR
jgi:hypothetical protein